MRIHGPAARLTIIVDAGAQWHHRPVYAEIIHRAHRDGLAGATALRSTHGYVDNTASSGTGHHGRHDAAPIMIVIIDDHTRIQTFLYSLDDLIIGGLVLIDDVHVIRFNRSARHDTHRRHRGTHNTRTVDDEP
jgi:hypothetical protein